MNSQTIENLGKPSIKLEGLQIWIHGRQFTDSADFWDGNWLNVTAHCGGQGASVFASGPIIHLSEIVRWKTEAEILQKTLTGKATLNCLEPNLSVSLRAMSLGHIQMEVSITNDQLRQKHWFEFEIDQSYIPTLVGQCASILENFSLRDVSNNG